jgi:hypothetical protein
MLNSVKTAILEIIQKIDPLISLFQAAKQWYTLKVYIISRMKALKDDIEVITELDLPILPWWMNEKSVLERFERDEIAYFITIIKVQSKAITDKCIVKEIDFSSKNHKVELFLEAKVDTIYSKCSQFGHDNYKDY